MTRKVLGSLLEISRDSTKTTKMIAEQEDNFWKDCEKRKVIKDTFELKNLNEIEHSKF